MENQNQNINQTPPVSPVIATPPISNQINPPTGGSKPKLPLAIIIGTIVFLLVVGSATGFYVLKQQSSKIAVKPTPTSSQTITPSPTPDPTASWKTYTGDGFSFKYPNNLFLKENEKNYFVLVKTADTPGNLSEISIDARLMGIFTNYNSAVENIKKTMTNVNEKTITDGVLIKGRMGPGMGQGTETLTALLKYKTGAIAIQNSTNPLQEVLFGQILSTFKFINQTPTPTCMPRPACLDATPRCMIAEPANGWCPTSQTCNTDADCASGSSCMTSGPLVAGQTVRKICVQKGTAVPL